MSWLALILMMMNWLLAYCYGCYEVVFNRNLGLLVMILWSVGLFALIHKLSCWNLLQHFMKSMWFIDILMYLMQVANDIQVWLAWSSDHDSRVLRIKVSWRSMGKDSKKHGLLSYEASLECEVMGENGRMKKQSRN